jgi:uncharacterized protein
MMFVIPALLTLILAHVYLHRRVRRYISNPRAKKLFTFLYVLAALAFPATEICSHAGAAGPVRPLLDLGYLTLPFLLYLLMLVLAIDILRGLNRLFRLAPVDVPRSPGGRIAVLAFLLVAPAVIVAAGRFHYSSIRGAEYHVKIQKRASHLNRLKIAFASDFHLNEMTDFRQIERFATMVNSLDADVLLLPGDLIETNRDSRGMREFEGLFRSLKTRYGIFASLGNHEYYHGAENSQFYSRANIALLVDTAVAVGGAFTIVGRQDPHIDSRKSIRDLMQTAADSLPVIVMDHRPTDLKRIGETGADIVVCGHTHNGQWFPINYIVNMIYDLSWGYAKYSRTNAFVSSGISLWGPPVRTTGDSEIVLIVAELTE